MNVLETKRHDFLCSAIRAALLTENLDRLDQSESIKQHLVETLLDLREKFEVYDYELMKEVRRID